MDVRAHFRLNDHGIDAAALRRELEDAHCGAVIAFDGVVRDHHDGRRVSELRYEAFAELAVSEGRAVVDEAAIKFAVRRIVTSLTRSSHDYRSGSTNTTRTVRRSGFIRIEFLLQHARGTHRGERECAGRHRIQPVRSTV